MTGFDELLRRTIASLRESSPAARASVYERARKILAARRPPGTVDAESELLAFDETVAKIESEFAAKGPSDESASKGGATQSVSPAMSELLQGVLERASQEARDASATEKPKDIKQSLVGSFRERLGKVSSTTTMPPRTVFASAPQAVPHPTSRDFAAGRPATAVTAPQPAAAAPYLINSRTAKEGTMS